MKKDDIIVKTYQEIGQNSTLRKDNKNDEVSSASTGGANQSQAESQKKKWIKIGIAILIAIIIGISILVYFLFLRGLNNSDDTDQNDDQNYDQNDDKNDVPKTEDPFAVIIPEYKEDNEKLESEFEFKTLVGDLRKIQVIQRYDEDRLFEGQRINKKK